MFRQIQTHWFLVGLAIVVFIGLTGHERLLPLASINGLMAFIVFAVMTMMAAPVPLELVRQTIARPWPALLAALINLGLLPLAGWLGAQWLRADLAGGLIVAAAVPSTLSSAAVMTRKAGGDDSVSIFVTLLTNISCVVVTPLWIVLLLGVEVDLSLPDMVTNLLLVVLLPILLVQLARWRSLRFCRWAERSRGWLATCCQVGILSMVLLGAVQMGTRWNDQNDASLPSASLPGEGWQVPLVIAMGMTMHLAALGLSWQLARWTGVRRPQRMAVCFSGSQKTLMIGLNLAIQCGVNILPMVTYHVFQLLVDALIAERWGRTQVAESTRSESSGQSSSVD